MLNSEDAIFFDMPSQCSNQVQIPKKYVFLFNIFECDLESFYSRMQYLSALTTFDILRNYADLPIKSIEEIANVIENPSNGFALESNAHNGFDNFTWSLKETNVDVLLYSALTLVTDPYFKENNEYMTAIYNHEGALGLTDDGQKVVFTNHSDDLAELSSPAHKTL
jgi:hypothetical protein